MTRFAGFSRLSATLLALVLGIAAPLASEAAGSVAVRAKTIHVVAGPSIEDGVIVIEEGKITAIGPRAAVTIPPGMRVLEAQVATPGLVDVRSTVGVSGMLNQSHDQDQFERSAPVQPSLRAIDAYDARDPLVAYVRSLGVTTVQTGHAPGEVVSGQLMVVKTAGGTVEDAVVVHESGVAVTLGRTALKSGGKSPGTRAKSVALLRAALAGAQDYQRKAGAKEGEPRARDLEREVLARVLDGEVPLVVTANRVEDIASALRLREEFGFRLVLDMAAEAPALLDEIRAAKVPILLHPTMYRSFGDTESLSFRTAATLADAGVPFAIQSGYESYVPKSRVVLFEAAVAAARGLGFERALRAVTLDAARILGIDARVGSLEVGKDGDVALFDGDPFETTTHVTGVVIDGAVVSETPR